MSDHSLRDKITEYLMKKYKTAPEYLWARFPEFAVFRHKDNRKWYAVLMKVQREKIGVPGEGQVDILNLKLKEPFLADILTERPGYIRAYHMNKRSWISVLLDESAGIDEIFDLIDQSFFVTAEKKKRSARK